MWRPRNSSLRRKASEWVEGESQSWREGSGLSALRVEQYLKNPLHFRQKRAKLLGRHLWIKLAPQQLLGDAWVPMESVLGQAAQQPAQALAALKFTRHGLLRARPPTTERGRATAAERSQNSRGRQAKNAKRELFQGGCK